MNTVWEEMMNTPITALKETPEQAITRLIHAHGDRLLRLCSLILGDPVLAEDALQETYVRAYKAYPRFRHDSSEATWLTRIAVNRCHSMRAKAWFRMEHRGLSPEQLPDSGTKDPFPDDTVLLAVARLKPRYKVPLLLYYYQGLPVREIARVLGLPVSTVSVRLMRARDTLREELKEWYFDE